MLRGLAADPEDRWPNVRTFVNALQALAPSADRTLLVSPPEAVRSTVETVDVPARGSGARLLLLLACVAVFLACFGGALVVTQQLH